MESGTSNQDRLIQEAFRLLSQEAAGRFSEQREQALAQALAVVVRNDQDPVAYITAARLAKQLGRLKEALAILGKGIARCDSSPALYEYYVERLEKCNRIEEAIATAREAMRLFPENKVFRLREALLLPVLYRTREQLDQYRQRFAKGLSGVCVEGQLDTSTAQQQWLSAIGKNVNKYLGYQGRDDRELQEMYGALVHRIMASNYPEYAQPQRMPRIPPDGRLRVGYVSARFRDMSVTKAFLGWLREHDRERVNVFTYHVGQRTDSVTHEVEGASQIFRQLGGSLEEAAQTIRGDELHILVYLDLGMDAIMTQLGALRLAPVQCVAWDHPVTSGLSTLDYFISSDLMEPRNAQQHYSEKLVRLPGIGMCCTKPVIPAHADKPRAVFQLREDAVLYLSCQSVFKYLPAQDSLFAQIAKRVPNSQFVFLVTNEVVRDDFEARLEGAFSGVGLRASDRCVLLPEQPRLQFWSLLQCADVFLDTIGWTGGVSTLDAVRCGLPIVTLPGNLMRGRQSYGILTQLGVTGTIANDETEYVDIAVRLGLDREWRQSVTHRMLNGHPNLYSDTQCVRALEKFYRRVVEERLHLQSGQASDIFEG